ncbi:MAG TPA: type II toxin-antitoxin system ParD family antitoxin [Ktedonobacteraceae bacterium]|nr:type II toxin-antitoxin system ParD family antitoxin [Ktedonobacteraceae bacterium]
MADSYSLDEHFHSLVAQVASGRDNNESEIVRDALRHAELRKLELQTLREHIENAIKKSGSYTDDDIAAILAADVEQ